MVDGKPVHYHYNIKGQWQGKYENSIQVNRANLCTIDVLVQKMIALVLITA